MAAAANGLDASPKHFEPDSISAILRHVASEATRLGEAPPEEGNQIKLAAAARDLDSLLQEEPIRELLLELQHSQGVIGGAPTKPPNLALAKQSASSTLQVTLIVPAAIAFFCLLLSPLLMALEEWTTPVSFNYLVATTCGTNPVGEAQNVAPRNNFGGLLLGVVATWSLGFAGYIVGQIVELRPVQFYLGFLTRLGKAGDFNDFGVIILQVFVLGPAMVFFAAALLGGMLAVAEGWSFSDGFLYILGDTTGQPNPLVGVSPRSSVGMRITSICAMWGYVACSTIIGLASNLVLPGLGTALTRALGRACLFGHSKVVPAC